MKKLEEYIKECNLVFTDTISRLDLCRVDFDVEQVTANYANSVSLLNLISSFNKLYLSFKEEYEQLEKLNLGKTIEVLDFSKFNMNDDNYRVLVFYINIPKITNHEETILYLREINGDIKPFVTNNINVFDKNYYKENISLHEDIAKKYLDLFEKYKELLNAYNYLKNSQILGDGTNSMFTTIDNYNSNLLEELKNFTISFGSEYFNTEYWVELSIKLGNDFGIDYDKSKIILDNQNIKADIEVCEKVLTKVHINKKYTKSDK